MSGATFLTRSENTTHETICDGQSRDILMCQISRMIYCYFLSIKNLNRYYTWHALACGQVPVGRVSPAMAGRTEKELVVCEVAKGA